MAPEPEVSVSVTTRSGQISLFDRLPHVEEVPEQEVVEKTEISSEGWVQGLLSSRAYKDQKAMAGVMRRMTMWCGSVSKP